jgi:hypothetical protein
VRHEVPACSLDPAQLRRWRTSWQDVRRQVEIVERRRLPGAFRITFRARRRALESIRSLVAFERECCASADWQVHVLREGAVLEVRAPEDVIEPLARAFGVGDEHRSPSV